MSQTSSLFVGFLLVLGLPVQGRLVGNPGTATALEKHGVLVTPVSRNPAVKGPVRGSPGTGTTLGPHGVPVTHAPHSQAAKGHLPGSPGKTATQGQRTLPVTTVAHSQKEKSRVLRSQGKSATPRERIVPVAPVPHSKEAKGRLLGSQGFPGQRNVPATPMMQSKEAKGRLLGNPGKSATLGRHIVPVTRAAQNQQAKDRLLGNESKSATLGRHTVPVTRVAQSQEAKDRVLGNESKPATLGQRTRPVTPVTQSQGAKGPLLGSQSKSATLERVVPVTPMAQSHEAKGRLLGSQGTAVTQGQRTRLATPVTHSQAAEVRLTRSPTKAVKGRVLGSPGRATTSGERIAPVSHSQAPAMANKVSKVAANYPAVTVHTNNSTNVQKHIKKKRLTDMEQLANFKDALQAVENLQADFTAGQVASGNAQGAQQTATDAMTTELHKQDSRFWTSIQHMLKETTGAMSKMTNASASGRKHILHVLESSVNASADALEDMTVNAGKKEEKQSDEYLVGLLNQHRNEWSMDKQLNVTKQFSSSSPRAQQLLKHHNMKEPFATQLARLMDFAPPASKSKVKKAAKFFLQLEDIIHDMQA